MDTEEAAIEEARQRIASLKTSILEVTKRCGRKAEEIGLVLVTKTLPPERILPVFRAGIEDFGENRVQELSRKRDQLPSEIKWHMVGHLQTNKVKQVVGKVVLIHSLDRIELAREIDRQAEKTGIAEVDCLIQVNSSGEETKFGLDFEAVELFVTSLPSDSRIRLRGLMTIGPLTEDRDRIRKAFRKMKESWEELKERFPDKDWGLLSMGMSSDYDIAIEEGANLLRIGTAFFGPRPGEV